LAQITNVTSESLQASIRRLLPSQQGFGEDLQASNVITPIIDLTPTAEGSLLRQDLQTALTLTQATAFEANNTTVDLANTPGFYRVICTITARTITTDDNNGFLKIDDGATSKVIVRMNVDATTVGAVTSQTYDLVVCLSPGETLQAKTISVTCFATGSVRPIADINGNLINPTGYTSE
jgi:hypothetical protein